MKKRVTFNEEKNIIYPLFCWSFAYKKARQNDYEKFILDRYRFEKRIKCVEMLLNSILIESHRNKVYNERFK